MSLQFGSNLFYQKLLNETRPRKPAPPPLGNLATPQKNTLCSFHFARAGFLFLLMKRVFFCGVLPSKYSGRWRDWPQFDFAKEKRNSPQTPLPLFSCSNGTGTEAGGQKFLPPNPLPFCPPAWASPLKLLDGRIFRRTTVLLKPFCPLSFYSRHSCNTRLVYYVELQGSKNLHAFRHSESFVIFHFGVYF